MKRTNWNLFGMIIIALVLISGIAMARPEVLNDVLKVDRGGTIDFLAGSEFKIAGVEITASAAELNYVDGAVDSVGATTGTTATATESLGFVQKTVIVLADTPIIVASGGAGTNGYGGTKIYDFPEGRILIQGVTIDSFTTGIDTNVIAYTNNGDYAFGTTVGAATSLSGTMVDLCPSTAIDTITNIVSSALAASAQFDGTSTAKDMYVNMIVDDANMGANITNTVDATITIHWINLGDY